MSSDSDLVSMGLGRYVGPERRMAADLETGFPSRQASDNG